MTRATRIPASSPALVDSSYTAFYVALTVVWAVLLSSYFPEQVRHQAIIIMIAFSLMLYVFNFLLKQFYSAVTVLNMVILYFGLSAVLAFLSAVRGPLADGTVPVISILFLAKIVIYSGPSLLVATVFPFYGAVTIALAAISAAICEVIYNLLLRVTPRPARRALRSVDARIDQVSDAGSWGMFGEREWAGAAAAAALLGLYAVLYIVVLIAD